MCLANSNISLFSEYFGAPANFSTALHSYCSFSPWLGRDKAASLSGLSPGPSQAGVLDVMIGSWAHVPVQVGAGQVGLRIAWQLFTEILNSLSFVRVRVFASLPSVLHMARKPGKYTWPATCDCTQINYDDNAD